MSKFNAFSMLFFSLLLSTQVAIAQQPDMSPGMTDHDMVYAAVEDYVLGLYEVAPERIEKSVSKDLHKIGYYSYNGEAYNHVPMTYQQLYDLSAKWNKKGDQIDDDTPQEIEIYEVYDKTASAKLTAKWGIDFMHLSKVDGKWQIMNIIWQSEPKVNSPSY